MKIASRLRGLLGYSHRVSRFRSQPGQRRSVGLWPCPLLLGRIQTIVEVVSQQILLRRQSCGVGNVVPSPFCTRLLRSKDRNHGYTYHLQRNPRQRIGNLGQYGNLPGIYTFIQVAGARGAFINHRLDTIVTWHGWV